MIAPQTDRAAIEALARELTDEQWTERFAELDGAAWNPGTRIRESTRALLAYLDEVWRGLTRAQRSLLNGYAERAQTWDAMRRRGLVLDEDDVSYEDARRDGFRTPLGRAVLKRVKEQER